jgi:hypothetical protein
MIVAQKIAEKTAVDTLNRIGFTEAFTEKVHNNLALSRLNTELVEKCKKKYTNLGYSGVKFKIYKGVAEGEKPYHVMYGIRSDSKDPTKKKLDYLGSADQSPEAKQEDVRNKILHEFVDRKN